MSQATFVSMSGIVIGIILGGALTIIGDFKLVIVVALVGIILTGLVLPLKSKKQKR